MAKKMVAMDPRLLRPPPPVSGLNVLYHLDGDTESIMQNQSFQESQKEDGEKASYFSLFSFWVLDLLNFLAKYQLKLSRNPDPSERQKLLFSYS